MNLIEQLGGYECAKAEYDDPMYEDGELYTIKATGARFFKHNLAEELLEYRRAHDLVIAGDYVVIEDSNHVDYGKIYQIKDDDIGSHWIKLVAMRHATDAEIKAGKRLEVK